MKDPHMTARYHTMPDVLIIGGGIAGSVAALLLARQGRNVTVVDPFAAYPDDFRCEKFTTDQLGRLKRLDLFGIVARHATPVRDVVVGRGGRAVDARATDELCFRYDTIVNAVRRSWPREVTFIEGRADDIDALPDRSTVTLTDGRRLNTRLVILATGPGEKLRARLGLERRIVRTNHSLCIGFDLVSASGGPLSHRALTYYGERMGDAIAYLTVFPFNDRTRCNLFAYLPPVSREITAIRKDPLAGLAPLMPGLASVIGADAREAGKPEMRITDLYDLPSPERDGVVVIGEAFRPSCPVTGTGVTRVLNDVEQLCMVHIPRWFEGPGMSRSKIAEFYADPVKRAVDDAAAQNAERQRHFATRTDAQTRARRLFALLKARANFLVSRQPTAALRLRPAEAYSAAALAKPTTSCGRADAQPRMTV